MRRFILILLVCVLAGAAAYAASYLAFCRAPPTTDENSYVLQAHNFLDGKLARPYPSLFVILMNQKQNIFDPDKGVFSRYPPGHVVWLMPGIALGDPFIMSALGAALVMLVLMKCGMLLGISRVIVAVFLLCSPFFIMTFGTLLSHTSGLVASSLLLLCYVLWRQTGSIKFAIMAGLAWGWLFHNRTLTAFCLAIPFGVDSLIRLVIKRDKKSFFGVSAFALTAVACVALLCVYNYLLTGNPFEMTYLAYDHSHATGFGPRHTKGLVIHHDLANGFRNLRDNIAHLDIWLTGFRGSFLIAVILAFVGWSTSWTPLLASAFLSVWIGYIFFWYPGPQETGPGYYLETLPFLCMASSMGVERIWSRFARFSKWRVVIAAVAIMLLAFVSIRFMIFAGRELRAEFFDRGRMIAFCRTIPKNSLVFVNRGPLEDYMINNPRGIDSDPLMLMAGEGSDKTVMKYFPDRSRFFLRHEGSSFWLDPAVPDAVHKVFIPVRSMSYHTGSNFSRDGVVLRKAIAGNDKKGWLAFGPRSSLFPGRFVVHYEMELSECLDDEEVCVLDIAAENGTIVIAEKKVFGNTPADEIKIELTVDDFVAVETRVYYSGRGNIVLKAIRISEMHETTER